MDRDKSREVEQQPLDISKRVEEIINSNRPTRAMELTELLDSDELSKAAALTLTLDYTTQEDALWVRAFIGNFDARSRGQERTASIRATEAQMNSVANVFTSGVKWIPVL